MWGRIGLIAAAFAMPSAAWAEPVAVRVVWDGNDAVGGILINRVRGLLAASADKREVVEPARGLAVLIQTIDPAAEFLSGAGRKPQMTVYSLVINVRPGDGAADTFASAALGYCAFVDLTSCSREIIGAIDEEIARRGLG
jgi:hypothetical protein